jgi:CheY-like chemotaxis protein
MSQQFDHLPFLIVEGSELDLRLLQRALRRARVPNPAITVATPGQAIRYLERMAQGGGASFPVVLFLDALTSSGAGLEVLRWLQAHEHPPLTVVLHTGVEGDDLLKEARDLGATLYLPKGARPEAVREVFRRARVEWEEAVTVQ